MQAILVRAAAGLVMATACSPAPDRGATNDSATRATAAPPTSADACFRTNESVLARRPGTVADGPPGLSGWIRLDDRARADSGSGRLVDSDGQSLGASWRRISSDSLAVTAFDDFLRIKLRVADSDSALTGSARAHSDAALERDSAGKQVEFRREWMVSAHRAPCDSIPGARNG